MNQFNEKANKIGSIDPYEVKKIEIHYVDGSKYVVYDQVGNIDNTNYLCGGMGESKNVLGVAFNRIIDTSKIKDITVNNEKIIVK